MEDYMLYLWLSLIFLHLPIAFSAPIKGNSTLQSSQESVFITSWRKGKRQIKPHDVEVTLDRQKREYQMSFASSEKEANYDLVIGHSPISEKGPYFESWNVMLFEDSPQYPKSKREPMNNLLKVSGGPFGGDYWPKEDNIGWLYPVDEPSAQKHGVVVYPISAKRIIKVENFYCTVQVTNYKRSPNNPREIDELTIKVKLSNSL
jgi:hypothetical protein